MCVFWWIQIIFNGFDGAHWDFSVSRLTLVAVKILRFEVYQPIDCVNMGSHLWNKYNGKLYRNEGFSCIFNKNTYQDCMNRCVYKVTYLKTKLQTRKMNKTRLKSQHYTIIHLSLMFHLNHTHFWSIKDNVNGKHNLFCDP